MSDPREHWPATERNRDPILEVLRRVLPAHGTLLEIASGSGQHAAYFSAALPQLDWQPSDANRALHASIAAWSAERSNVLPVIALDVLADPWPLPLARYDAVFNANMIHIAPFEVCHALLRGVAAHLAPGGRFVLYGPFRIDGAHTAESNAAFDRKLRAENPSWGVRDLEQVTALAAERGLRLLERVAMPANNQLLVFERA
jgi:SAM-dependent methyltransferase